MDISDIRSRVDALNGRSSLVSRAEPEEFSILTLGEDRSVQSAANEMLDPLIQALIDKLPKPHSTWSIDDRGNWLKAAAMAFNLIYRTPEREEQAPSAFKSVG